MTRVAIQTPLFIMDPFGPDPPIFACTPEALSLLDNDVLITFLEYKTRALLAANHAELRDPALLHKLQSEVEAIQKEIRKRKKDSL